MHFISLVAAFDALCAALQTSMVDYYSTQDAATVALVATMRSSIVTVDIRQTRPGVINDVGRLRDCLAMKAAAILNKHAFEHRQSLEGKLQALHDTIANMLTPNANINLADINAVLVPLRARCNTEFQSLDYVNIIQTEVTRHLGNMPTNTKMQEEVTRLFNASQKSFLTVIKKHGDHHTTSENVLIDLNKSFVEYVIDMNGIISANTMFANSLSSQVYINIRTAVGDALTDLFGRFDVHPTVAQRLRDKVFSAIGRNPGFLNTLRIYTNRSLTDKFIKSVRDLFMKVEPGSAAKAAVLRIMTPVCGNLHRTMTGKGAAEAQYEGLVAALRAPLAQHATMKMAIASAVLEANMDAVRTSWNAGAVNFDRLLQAMMNKITAELIASRDRIQALIAMLAAQHP